MNISSGSSTDRYVNCLDTCPYIWKRANDYGLGIRVYTAIDATADYKVSAKIKKIMAEINIDKLAEYNDAMSSNGHKNMIRKSMVPSDSYCFST